MTCGSGCGLLTLFYCSGISTSFLRWRLIRWNDEQRSWIPSARREAWDATDWEIAPRVTSVWLSVRVPWRHRFLAAADRRRAGAEGEASGVEIWWEISPHSCNFAAELHPYEPTDVSEKRVQLTLSLHWQWFRNFRLQSCVTKQTRVCGRWGAARYGAVLAVEYVRM